MSGTLTARPPRLAIGILAHQRPELVRALIEALASDDIAIVLHVDASSAFSPDAYLPDDASCVTLVEPRLAVRWGAVSLIDAIIAIMRTARELRPEYYSLISGVCWPTRTPDQIVERLCGSGQAAFLSISPLRAGWSGRLDQFHLTRDLPGPLRRAEIRVRIRLPLRNRDRIPPAYGGSTWMDLRGDVLDWLVDRIDADPGYRRAFAFTHLSDEIFIHTLLMDSPYRDELVAVNDPDQHLLGLRYIRWQGGWHPETLTAADLEAAGRADCIFARKLP